VAGREADVRDEGGVGGDGVGGFLLTQVPDADRVVVGARRELSACGGRGRGKEGFWRREKTEQERFGSLR
jgi:hypothetical protein